MAGTAAHDLALNVADLTVYRDGGQVLLRLPHLALAPGTLLGIRGPSGAGKSTLLLALAGLLDRVDGRVSWGDTDLLSLSREGRARFRADNLGIVFQDFLLFDELDAVNNASLAAMFRPRAARRDMQGRARQLLRNLGLPEATRAVSSFSGGERQRVGVARALAADAPVLLADEPTASLDREAADRLIVDLTRMARQQGRTLIAVSHDPALLAAMDRVLTVVDGTVTEGGAAP